MTKAEDKSWVVVVVVGGGTYSKMNSLYVQLRLKSLKYLDFSKMVMNYIDAIQEEKL